MRVELAAVASDKAIVRVLQPQRTAPLAHPAVGTGKGDADVASPPHVPGAGCRVRFGPPVVNLTAGTPFHSNMVTGHPLDETRSGPTVRRIRTLCAPTAIAPQQARPRDPTPFARAGLPEKRQSSHEAARAGYSALGCGPVSMC